MLEVGEIEYVVASFTDAWIETVVRLNPLPWSPWSHLLQMRGLKPHNTIAAHIAANVASFTDAWIETVAIGKRKHCFAVASFTDAWIETSHPVNVEPMAMVASFTDAWIETIMAKYILVKKVSHLLQMRGLKLDNSP